MLSPHSRGSTEHGPRDSFLMLDIIVGAKSITPPSPLLTAARYDLPRYGRLWEKTMVRGRDRQLRQMPFGIDCDLERYLEPRSHRALGL
jgi:hypothetical protein